MQIVSVIINNQPISINTFQDMLAIITAYDQQKRNNRELVGTDLTD